MRKYIFLIVLISYFGLGEIKGREIIEIAPLFEYPVAPEDMESLEERCDYIVKNFWSPFDFKKKQAIDQYALNEAFHVYSSAFRFATLKEVNQSVDQLIKNVSSNPVYLLQFTRAAEENLYGPRADFWSDEIYLKFIDSVIKNKKIPQNRKDKYIKQAKSLRESSIGSTAPSFWFQDKERASKQYFPMSTPTILIFGDPEDTDWRLTRLKMDSNYKLNDALTKGKVNILFIIPREMDNWQTGVSNYNKYWTIGQSNDASSIYDLRLSPAIYVIDSNGKIINKNLTADQAVEELLLQIN